jgi:hypothetical protein
MGCQEYFINHTRSQVWRIDNSGHQNLFSEIRVALNANPDWTLDDDMELFITEFGNGDFSEMKRLLLEERYTCDDPQRFLDEKELDEYLNAE